MQDLEVFQVAEPFVGDRDVTQVVVDVGQHQARAVDVEDRVRGLDDLVQGILDPHLAEPQLPEFGQRPAHIVRGDLHVFPSLTRTAAGPQQATRDPCPLPDRPEPARHRGAHESVRCP
jgi:hypothetical protein